MLSRCFLIEGRAHIDAIILRKYCSFCACCRRETLCHFCCKHWQHLLLKGWWCWLYVSALCHVLIGAKPCLLSIPYAEISYKISKVLLVKGDRKPAHQTWLLAIMMEIFKFNKHLLRLISECWDWVLTLEIMKFFENENADLTFYLYASIHL